MLGALGVFFLLFFHCTFTSFYGDGYNTQLRQGVAFSVQGLMIWQRLDFWKIDGPGRLRKWHGMGDGNAEVWKLAVRLRCNFTENFGSYHGRL